MNKLKLWLEQTMMISFAIYVGIIIEGVVYSLFPGGDLASFSLSWLQLLSVILTGVVCALLTVLFLSYNDISKKDFIVRIVFHTIGLYAIVSIFGWIFKWYTQLAGFIMMTVIFFMVYAFVWGVSLWFHKRDDNKINKT